MNKIRILMINNNNLNIKIKRGKCKKISSKINCKMNGIDIINNNINTPKMLIK
jgi:hypothetical protein